MVLANETPRLKAVVSGETASPSILFELVSPTGKASGTHKFKNRPVVILVVDRASVPTKLGKTNEARNN